MMDFVGCDNIAEGGQDRFFSWPFTVDLYHDSDPGSNDIKSRSSKASNAFWDNSVYILYRHIALSSYVNRKAGVASIMSEALPPVVGSSSILCQCNRLFHDKRPPDP